MAVSTSSYFSNSIIGVPQVGADIDIYDSSSTPKYAVGFGFKRADGNQYRYCHFGALTNRGLAVATDITESSFTSTSLALLSPTLVTPAGERVGPNVIDSNYIQMYMTTLSATADQFAGGYVAITNTGSGTGYSYRIKGNTATNNPSTSYCYLELYDKLKTPVDSTTAISIAGCPYANLEAATTTDILPIGATVTNNSAASFGWAITRGLGMALTDASFPKIGYAVQLSTTTAGAITHIQDVNTGTVSAHTLAYPIGYCVVASSSTEYSLINFTLE